MTQFSDIKLNGRQVGQLSESAIFSANTIAIQIKNVVKIAYNVVMSENTGVCTSHLQLALT